MIFSTILWIKFYIWIIIDAVLLHLSTMKQRIDVRILFFLLLVANGMKIRERFDMFLQGKSYLRNTQMRVIMFQVSLKIYCRYLCFTFIGI